MKTNTIKKIGTTVAVMSLALVPAVVFGADAGTNFGLDYAQTSGLGTSPLLETVGSIIKTALGLLGIVALVIILWAGFEWMTAGGSDEKVTNARKRMIAGVIGLAIIFSSYALSAFVLEELSTSTGYGEDEAAGFAGEGS